MSVVEQRIRERAYRIWIEEGCPKGRELDRWDMATELVAIEDGQKSTLLRPPPPRPDRISTLPSSNANALMMCRCSGSVIERKNCRAWL
jgi:hypothetical protein